MDVDTRLQDAVCTVQARDQPPERQPHARLPGGGGGADVARAAGRRGAGRRRDLGRPGRARRAAVAHRARSPCRSGRRRSRPTTSSTSRSATRTPPSGRRHRPTSASTSSAMSPTRVSTPRRAARSAVPRSIAKALGAASHEGHLVLAFARPAEQRLAEELDAAGQVRPVRSDSLAVTTSNFAANKIDYYLDRTVDYQVMLAARTRTAHARAWRASSRSTSTTPRRRPGSRRSSSVRSTSGSSRARTAPTCRSTRR